MIKKLYILIKSFCKFIACIEDYTILNFYETLQKILSIFKLLILEYKHFATYYITITFC